MPTSEIILDDATREAMRQVIVERGEPVDTRDRGRYGDDSYFANDISSWISTFGWRDYDASEHLREGCSLIVPQGVTVAELNFSQFENTNQDNSQHHGLSAYGGDEGAESEIRCACGQLRGMVLLYQGTFSDLVRETLSKLNPSLDVVRSPGFKL